MKHTVQNLKVGSYTVIPQRDGTFRVVHTWLGTAVGTYPRSADAVKAARQSTEDEYLVRMLGKEDALQVIRRRNGYPE